MANTVRVATQVTGVGKASSDLDRLRDKFEKLQKGGPKGFAIGVGVAAGAAAFSLLSQAASGAVDFFGDATKAALEEEDSIQKLGTALRANVPAWDGNTKAIERVLAARMALGFSDDEQRDSLAILVARTGDVTKALDIERAAMDLARLRSIPLAEATKAISMGMMGTGRALKELGINVKDYASGQEILTAIQKKAAGQAQDYANTNSGKLLKSQVEVGEAMERFGAATLPAVVVATEDAAGVVTGLASAFDLLQGKIPQTADEIQSTTSGIADLTRGLAFLFPGLGAMADTLDAIGTASAGMEGKVADDLAAVDRALAGTADQSKDTARVMRHSAASISLGYDELRVSIADDAKGIIDDFFDPLETRAELFDTRSRLRADMESLRLAKSKTDHRNASDDIIQALDDQATALTTIGDKGKLTRKDVEAFAADVKAAYKGMGKTVPTELQKILDKLYQLANFQSLPIDIRVTSRIVRPGTGGKSGGKGRLASGGPVDPGEVYRVGENGPEWFVSDKAGDILPNGVSPVAAPTGRGGVAGTTLNLTVNVAASPGMTPGQARAVGNEVGPVVTKWMQQNGILPRGATGLTG
jgi:hypothetical protein